MASALQTVLQHHKSWPRQVRRESFAVVIPALVAVMFLGTTSYWSAFAEEPVYEATWESLDSRETPVWFQDAKFGIFIHWGLYSVPSWSPKGTYAEWYWHAKDGAPRKHEAAVARSAAVNDFHERVYGNDFAYRDFRPFFTCELFDPKQWAQVFKRSGARYVVLTSKHHDGYCLWPSAEASESFGTPWNSVESGPHRDLVGELTEAVRSQGIKMGLYYSIWDWFNPYWPEAMQPYGGKKKSTPAADQAREKYIREVMYPQLKELVAKYQPSLIFSDGDWWMGDEAWQTKQLLAWIFNNAPNKNEVVINDRWGKVRGKHGGYFTTEYGAGFDDPEVIWEENRGIGMSFGYNREETLSDYNSAEQLILMLVDTVSRGGNLLLDIGPTHDGRIPVVMEERLAEIGAWLAVNGEAIYGSRRWLVDAQWSTGKQREFSKEDHHSGRALIESTLAPKSGYAVRQAMFTRKGDRLYAMTPGWPKSKELQLKGLRPLPGSVINLLGLSRDLSWQQVGDDIKIDLSEIGIHDLPCDHVYTFKISGVTASN